MSGAAFKFNDRSKQALAQAEQNVGEHIGQDFLDVATEVAKDESPVLTGNNRDSITWDVDERLRWRIYTQSNYGAWLELGTSRISPRPYMSTGVQRAMREFNNSGPWR